MPTISSHVIGLMSLLDVQGIAVRITAKLSRPDYLALDKVLQACGGKWDRKAGAHLFPEGAADILDAAMLTGEYTNHKQNFDQFDSPQAVIESVLSMAQIKPGMVVLEPSAGLGFLATEAASLGALVDVYELDPKRAEVLQQNPAIQHVGERDFMGVDPGPIYDRVIMNPPFSRQQDIDHVSHALKFLAPGGILVSVMSAGVLFRSNRKTEEFRDKIINRGGIFTRLPEGSFKSSGTMVETVLVKVTSGKG